MRLAPKKNKCFGRDSRKQRLQRGSIEANVFWGSIALL